MRSPWRATTRPTAPGRLKRVIQQRIQNPLAVELLKQEFPAGSRVKIDYTDGDFAFQREGGAG